MRACVKKLTVLVVLVSAPFTQVSPVSAADLDLAHVVAVDEPTKAQVESGLAVAVAREDSSGSLKIDSYVAPNPQTATRFADKTDDRSDVVAASVDSISQATSNDTFYNQQWDMDREQSDLVHTKASGRGVIVAVVDTGVDATHPDLAGQVLQGTDFVNSGNGQSDPNGHGTHVAGTIAANSDNSLGVTSMAPGAKILPVRVLDASGSGWDSNISQGITWAADHGAKVINLSLGGDQATSVEQAAVNYATKRGALVVAAAGNEAQKGNPVMYPAGFANAFAVASTNNANDASYFSEWGSQVDIAAPGETILSTHLGGTYRYMSGTSMAAPHVAGAAALLFSADSSLSNTGVRSYLEQSADDLGARGRDDHFGYGLLNINRALDQATEVTHVQLPASAPRGAWTTAGDGGVFSFGGANFYGSTGGMVLNQPIVGMSTTGSGRGYRFVASDGGVFNFGDADFYGSTGSMRLNKPVVGLSPTPSGRGYWLVASDGGIFSFGDAGFYGSTGSMRLNKPVVGMASTPSGRGYWLVASDGGIFSFGDAGFYGSTGGRALDAPVVGMSVTPSGNGYYITTKSGHVFDFGDGAFRGEAVTSSPIVSISTTPYGTGYVLAAADGSVFSRGDARALVLSSGSMQLNKPVVGVSLAAR